MCQFFSLENEVDFFLYRSSSSADIFSDCFFEFFQTIRCIVKIFDRLMQCLSRIISQKSLEVSERNSTLVEIIIIFYSIIRSRALNKKVNSPVLPFGVSEIRKVLLTLYDRKRLSLRISAICDDLFAKP